LFSRGVNAALKLLRGWRNFVLIASRSGQERHNTSTNRNGRENGVDRNRVESAAVYAKQARVYDRSNWRHDFENRLKGYCLLVSTVPMGRPELSLVDHEKLA
jgi:hypothetical protein